jgi:aspartyl-tRNA(Asn)/glutamyl-tRNA(Gln) amidotransferase subunit C
LRRKTRVCYRLAEAAVRRSFCAGRSIRFGCIVRQELLPMSVDAATTRRIAQLARIAVKDDEIPHLQGEINAVLAFVEQLSEVNVDGIEPMTSVTPMAMKKRQDIVTDGEIPDAVVANAPLTEDHFFLVPKVVE